MNEQTRKWQQSDMRDRWEMREWKKDDWDKLKETKGWLIEIEMNKWIENNLANLMIEKNEKMRKDWLKERKIGKRKGDDWQDQWMNEWTDIEREQQWEIITRWIEMREKKKEKRNQNRIVSREWRKKEKKIKWEKQTTQTNLKSLSFFLSFIWWMIDWLLRENESELKQTRLERNIELNWKDKQLTNEKEQMKRWNSQLFFVSLIDWLIDWLKKVNCKIEKSKWTKHLRNKTNKQENWKESKSIQINHSFWLIRLWIW